MAPPLCSARTLGILLFVVSAIPLGLLVSLERAKPSTHVYFYHSSGFLRECAKWDDAGRRFLVSFFDGGVGEVRVGDRDDEVLEEAVLVRDADLAGYASLGIAVDHSRNRLLVVIADFPGNRYSALAAYDLSTWRRLFLAQLSGPSDEKAFADDVAVDREGNAYVTDVRTCKIWKVSVDGKLMSAIESPLFTPKQWYKNLVGLNGIVYHPGGFLIAIHTFSGNLFKIDISNGDRVSSVNVTGGSLAFGDGLELLSPTTLVVAGNPSARLVESSDGWNTASVVATYRGPAHRLATAATVKDGRVYLNHMVGLGFPTKKHAIVEAVFSA